MSENKEKESIIQRSWKDSVFVKLFTESEYQVAFCQAIHPELNVQESDIKLISLENVILTEMYNDLGLQIGDNLIVLAEAQSTWTDNILVRGLFYLALTLKQYLHGQKLFGKAKVHLPRLELYVIYADGKNSKAPCDELNLTKDFYDGIPCAIDVTAKVFTKANNPGGIIAHYIEFAEIMTQQIEMLGRNRDAATKAIDICIERGIMKNFLVEQKKEVVDIMISMFNQVEQTILYGEEKLEEGLKKGLQEGLEKGLERTNRMQAELKEKMRRAGELPMFLEAIGNQEKMVELYERFNIRRDVE